MAGAATPAVPGAPYRRPPWGLPPGTGLPGMVTAPGAPGCSSGWARPAGRPAGPAAMAGEQPGTGQRHREHQPETAPGQRPGCRQARGQQRPAAAGQGDQQQPQPADPGPASLPAAADTGPRSGRGLLRPAVYGWPRARRAGRLPRAVVVIGSTARPWRPGTAAHASAAPKNRAVWRRANSAASARLITKVPGWAAVHRFAVAGPVKCST